MSHQRIFGEEMVQREASTSNKMNASSIQGGIFGTDPLPRPPPSRIGASSIKGGIFSEDAVNSNAHQMRPHTPRDSMQDTLSGCAGWDRDDVVKARLDPNAQPTAGLARSVVPLFGEKALQPSAKHDPNRPSIQGGIFGDCRPDAQAKQSANRNQSSIMLG